MYTHAHIHTTHNIHATNHTCMYHTQYILCIYTLYIYTYHTYILPIPYICILLTIHIVQHTIHIHTAHNVHMHNTCHTYTHHTYTHHTPYEYPAYIVCIHTTHTIPRYTDTRVICSLLLLLTGTKEVQSGGGRTQTLATELLKHHTRSRLPSPCYPMMCTEK